MAQTSTHWNVGDTILDLYQVLDILGEGGFGKVYKVHHQGWNVDLAVKSPKPEIVAAAGGVESFEQEAETWVNLGLHPHTVSCYYVRRIENSPLVFAEYVAGRSLADWIENRTLYEDGAEVALKRILDIAIQFAWGLHYAHEQGLIHQDVKPANVMMTPQGIVKVTDFGLAKGRMNAPVVQEGKEGTHTLITEGSGAMTRAYCSPEQANGESLTRRTDLWSWAVSVLEMFQGERTWVSGIVVAEVLESYLEMGQDDLQLPQMPESVAELLRRCFRENPDERPHTMLDLANELRGIFEQVSGETYSRTEPDAAKEIADSLNNRALSLLDLGKEEKALQLWEHALQVQPDHAESTYNRGLILWRTARIDDSALVGDMEKARATRAGYWLDNYLLGLVHLERDDCEAAIKTLQSIQGIQAQSEEIQAALTEAQTRLPQSKRLLHTFEEHKGWVESVSLSADGRFALSQRWYDKPPKLWELATGRCLCTFTDADGTEDVCLSADGRFVVSTSDFATCKVWILDWELEDQPPAYWDEGARPYLEIFLNQQTPYAATLPKDREPTQEEINLTLTRRGIPTWTKQDFQNLLYTLGCAGYGWLRPEGVRQQLEAMVASKPKPSPLVGNLIAQTPQVPSSPDKKVTLTEQFPESSSVESEPAARFPEPPPLLPEPVAEPSQPASSVESELPARLPEPPPLLPEPVAEEIQPASLPTPSEIESTPERRRQVSPFIRTNRVAIMTFLASYTFLAILLQSTLNLGWLGSLLLPVIPAFLLTLCLSSLLNPSRR